MPSSYFPLRWESTGDQWWYASPIDFAAANGHYDVVRELLYLDTNLLIKLTSLCRIRRLETVWDDDEEQQFQDVPKNRSQVAQKLFLECENKKGYNSNSLIRAGYGGWLLYTAVSAGDIEFVKKLLERDPLLVFGEGEYGVTDILYGAARSKNSDVFRLVLDSAIKGKFNNLEEIDPVFKWDMMNRAIHAAARGGCVVILKEILGDCNDVLVYRDGYGSTILHSGSGRGQVEVVNFLLASYDIITATDQQGNTAFHIAAYRGHSSVLQILLEASPSTALLRNNFGDTFLHMAVAGFRSPGFRRLDRLIDLIKNLINGKITIMEDIINVKNNDGRTALHLAVIDNVQFELVEVLLSAHSVDLNARDLDGYTPLDLLRRRPRSALSEILIKEIISAGGISNCRDYITRNALVSHLKMQVTENTSPGTSFRIPDGEIFLYTKADGGGGYDGYVSTDYEKFSGEISYCGSSIGSEKRAAGRLSSVSKRLKMLLRFASRKERQEKENNLDDFDDSITPYKSVGKTPVSLRERYSNKRVLGFSNDYPNSDDKKKFGAGLMQGVMQVKRQLYFGSPSSTLSESSMSSPKSVDKGTFDVVNKNKNKNNNNNSGLLRSILSPNKNKKMNSLNRGNGSVNSRLMNEYLCFGAQGIGCDDPNTVANYEARKPSVS